MSSSPILSNRDQSSLALLTDLYQLTMAYGYWKNGLHENEAVFNLIFRTAPFQGRYVICAGLATVVDFLNQAWHFTEDDVAYLATLKDSEQQPLFETSFLRYLRKMKFNCDVDAIAEGTVVFPQEPLLRIKGPLVQCQLLETVLLNIINFQSLVATKAARICAAAGAEPVLEFGLRRAQGIDGGLAASRAAYLGGCTATSNVLAGKLYDISVRGTHAHSWVMSFPSELIAFQAYAAAYPGNCVFLVDTYNTLEGVKQAIAVGEKLRADNHRLLGIRLDSGNLATLSIEARKLLDAAGFTECIIVGSNELDEQRISELKNQGAKINAWGVGTRLVTAYDQPALDGVYKLSAIRDATGVWQDKIKLSEQSVKVSTPGLLQVRRFYQADSLVADVIYDERRGVPVQCVLVDFNDSTQEYKIPAGLEHTEMLQPIFRAGKCVSVLPSLHESRASAQQELQRLPENIRCLANPQAYRVGLEQGLAKVRQQLISKSSR